MIRDRLGGFQETTWSRAGAYGADEAVTRVVAARPARPGWGSTRMRTYSEPAYETRQLWIGFGSVPDSRSDYLEQTDYRENWWRGPIGPKDVRRDPAFYDSGRLVYNQRTPGDGSNQVLTNQPRWLWREVQKGTYYNLQGDSVFSLVPGGGSFNLLEVGGWLGQLGRGLAGAGQAFVGGVETIFKPLEQSMGNAAVIFKRIGAIGHAMDVNFRTPQGDLGTIVGSIDFGKISLPTLDDLGFDDVDFGKVFDIDFKWPEVKFANPLASIDFAPIFEPGAWSELARAAFKTISGDVRDGLDWIGNRIMTASDWLAKRDPLREIGHALGVEWAPSGKRKVVLVAPGERFLEAGYTRDQAALLHDIMDKTSPDLRGRFLDEFTTFLAEEGQRVSQAHLAADGGELNSAGHAVLQQAASQAAQANLAIVVRSANPNSLQWHGKKGFLAKPGNLALKTNPKTGLVTATRRADGTLVDAVGNVVKGRKVDAQGWIVNTDKLVNGKPVRTNYRLDSTGHVVDAKGTKFFSDYDILCVDKAPVAGTGWLGVPTGTKGTGPRAIIDELNEAIVGNDRSRDMFKHGANRKNLVKDATGMYQVDTPEIGDEFAVIDPDGSIFIGDRLYVKRLLEGREIPTHFVVPPVPNPVPVPGE